MADFKITKGYNVPIAGEASENLSDLAQPPFLGVCPVEFRGLKPKLTVKVNDEVKVGTPLFFDKKNPNLQFVSPAGGRVTAINYGPRRVIEEIVISRDGSEQYEEFEKYAVGKISGLSRGDLVTHLLKGGLWPYVRSRPFSKIADPDESPKALFINCMDSAPLANNPSFSLKDKGDAFAAGVAAARVLCSEVHLCQAPGANFSGDGVQSHTFSGKHPAGLVGTHISKINPINKGDSVWYIHARDLVLIGEFLLTGRYPTERVVAVAGPGASKTGYFKTRLGVKLKDVTSGCLSDGEQRLISGDVLSGTAKNEDAFLGFYDDLVTVIPEGREQHFVGWMMPGFNIPSFTRVFVSGILGGAKKFAMNTNLNGGHRAIIQSGMWESVVALDIFPEHLTKATIAGDIDAMEQLGILECAPEDFALCTYVCPSKTEVSDIIAKGLELMEKEG